MTPKQKAVELISKYIPHTRIWDEIDCWVADFNSAQKCALIAVDEILYIKLLWYQKDTKELDYWKEVKKELEK